MVRQTRPNNNRVSGGDGFNIFIAGKSTIQNLARLTGNPEYASWSSRGIALVMSANEHLTDDALDNVLKEELYEKEFAKKGTIDGYQIDNIPLYKRSELKDNLWKENTNFEGEQGKWSPELIDMREAFIKQYRKKIERIGSVRSLEDVRTNLGAIGLLASFQNTTEGLRADLSNPEFLRFIELHDNDPVTPLISGKPGAGKSNLVLHMFRMSGLHNRGYINPAYGNRSRLRAYLPNFDGDNDRALKLKPRVFPGIPSSYSYRFPWQIFVDEPKGSSILWTKYDWSMAQEEEQDDSAGIFSMVYLGEIGLGKLRYAQSKEVGLYRSLFQLTRQMRVRYYLSSADPEPIPVGSMEDFIDPQIWLDFLPSGARTAKAEYLVKNENGSLSTRTAKLGSVPLDPLTKIMGKGIASDMTAAWERFNFQQLLEYSRATNVNIYIKDPDSVMANATQYVMDFQDRYMDEVYPSVVERNVVEVNHRKEPVINDEEDDDKSTDF